MHDDQAYMVHTDTSHNHHLPLPDVNTTSGPQACNVDVHLAISKDDGSVTLIYNSPRPNVTLFCGVDGIRARLCEDMHARPLWCSCIWNYNTVCSGGCAIVLHSGCCPCRSEQFCCRHELVSWHARVPWKGRMCGITQGGGLL